MTGLKSDGDPMMLSFQCLLFMPVITTVA